MEKPFHYIIPQSLGQVAQPLCLRVPEGKWTLLSSHRSRAQPGPPPGPLLRDLWLTNPFSAPPFLTSYPSGAQVSQGAGHLRTKPQAPSHTHTPPPHCFLQAPTGWIRTLAARRTPSKSPATSRMVDRRVSSPSQPPRYPSAPGPQLAARPWGSHLPFLNVSFFTYKLRMNCFKSKPLGLV